MKLINNSKLQELQLGFCCQIHQTTSNNYFEVFYRKLAPLSGGKVHTSTRCRTCIQTIMNLAGNVRLVSQSPVGYFHFILK